MEHVKTQQPADFETGVVIDRSRIKLQNVALMRHRQVRKLEVEAVTIYMRRAARSRLHCVREVYLHVRNSVRRLRRHSAEAHPGVEHKELARLAVERDGQKQI